MALTIAIVVFQNMEEFSGGSRLVNFAVSDVGRNVRVTCTEAESFVDIWPRAQTQIEAAVNAEFSPREIVYGGIPVVDGAQMVVSNARASDRR